MGGDGGSLLNKRKDVNRTRLLTDNNNAADSASVRAADAVQRWHYCALSNARLQPPLCIDLAGNIYNKASVVDHLLRRKQFQQVSSGGQPSDVPVLAPEPAPVPHIRKLRDIKEIVLAGPQLAAEKGWLVCPLTRATADSGVKPFVCSWRCGHVMAQGVWEERTGAVEDATCPVCLEFGGDLAGDDDETDRRDKETLVAVRLLLPPEEGVKQAEELAQRQRKKRPRE